MVVYCDLQAVKRDTDSTVKPVTLCHFLKNKSWWYEYTKESFQS